MKKSNNPLEKCADEQIADLVPAPDAKKGGSAGLKMLFAATTIIAVALTYQTVKQAIGLHRTIFIYEESAEIFAKTPFQVGFARQPLLKAKLNASDRTAKAD